MKKDKKPFNAKLFYRRTYLIIYDIISVIFSSYIAVLIRYEFHLDTVPEHFLTHSSVACSPRSEI